MAKRRGKREGNWRHLKATTLVCTSLAEVTIATGEVLKQKASKVDRLLSKDCALLLVAMGNDKLFTN